MIAALALSCNEEKSNKDFKPIVFGDSSLIVTETDEQYLSNNVTDIEQRFIPKEETPSVDNAAAAIPPTGQQKVTDATNTVTTETSNPLPQQDEKGFTLKITPEASIVFTNIDAKELKTQNAIKENSLSYLQTEGDILQTKLVLVGASEVSIQQRYQSKVIVKQNNAQIVLSSLGKHLSDWKTVKVNQNKTETLNKTEINNPQYPKLNNAKIKVALDKALRSKKAKQAEKNKWHNVIKKVKSTKEAPCYIKVDNVQWIIKGKDKAGIPFQKNIRIDVR